MKHLNRAKIYLLTFFVSVSTCVSYVPKMYMYFWLQENYWRYFEIISCTKLKKYRLIAWTKMIGLF